VNWRFITRPRAVIVARICKSKACPLADADGEAVDGGDLTAFQFKTLPKLAEALAAKRLPLHTTQDAVDLPKMVQVVCRFQADELLDRLPSAYLVDPIALHPPCVRDRLQQS